MFNVFRRKKREENEKGEPENCPEDVTCKEKK